MFVILKSMVMTEKALRNMIRAQIRLLKEEGDKPAAGSSAKAAAGEKTDTKGAVDVNKLASKLNIDVKTLGIALKAAKTGDATKGKELVALVKSILAADPATSKEVGVIFSKVTEK
jgi:hypothetical protein